MSAVPRASGDYLMEFRILGPIEVLDNGVSVDLGAPKQRAVLAVLLLHANQAVSADRLIDLVWGDDPPRTAGHALQTYISELRKAFDSDGEVIATRRPGYELRAGEDAIDARRFERLVTEGAGSMSAGDRGAAAEAAAAALDLWRGPPLPEFAYEEFAHREIQRLEELHARAVATLGESYIADGRPLDAVPMLRDVTHADPLREELRRLLMLALFAGGRQPDALREFRDYREALAGETGLDPSPELLRLEEQILLRDPSLQSTSDAVKTPHAVERNPYKGLRAFGEADASEFFGRDALTRQLLGAASSPMTVVVGPSGSGKSSAVHAGLIPAIRGGAVGDPGAWVVATLTPGRYPFAEFDAAMARLAGSAVGTSDPDDDTSITRSILRLLPAEPVALLLVIDQFEELFTLTDSTTRRAFLRNLATTAAEPHGRIRVLLTVRADFYDRPLLYPEFAEVFTDNVVNVIPLTPAGIEAAAVEPARQVGVGFAPDLLAQLVADMTDQPGALPLFQYTLTELFDEQDESTMTLDGYRRIGGLAGALSRRADAVYDSLDPDGQATAHDVFLRLVKPTEDRYTGRPVAILELEGVGDPHAVSRVLTRFGDNRLLTFDRDPESGAATCEVSHEALLAGWERLAGWLDDARSDIAQLDGLASAAAEWEAAERDPGYLLTGARLDDYRGWTVSTAMSLPAELAAFLDASVTEHVAREEADAERTVRERRVQRRARIRLWGFLAAVVALVAVVTFFVLVAADRPPPIALLYSGPDDGGWNDQMVAAVEQAAIDFDVEIAYPTSSVAGLPDKMTEVIESGTDLILDAHGSVGAVAITDIVVANPETSFVIPDIAAPPWVLEEDAANNPHVSFPIFASHDGAFLVGVAAARTTETGTIGFIGGMETYLINQYLAGFQAGIEYVERVDGADLEVVAEYLTPPFDMSGFMSWTLGYEAADRMFRGGADVIFTVAGSSGEGARDAAYDVSVETELHRWHIGVDVDEYSGVEANDPENEFDSHRVLPHILTSMVKWWGPVMYQAVEDYANDRFSGGVTETGLAEDSVDYVETGGHLGPDLVEELEFLKAKIIAGEIEVPRELEQDDESGNE